MLNLTFVKSFVTLAETGSFQKAAERLNLAQPTLSQHISKLEEILGVQLIERRRLGSNTTKAGENVLTLARTLLKTANEMKQVVSESVIRIGASDNISDYFLVPALSDLTDGTIKWQLKQAENTLLIDWLKEGFVDLAITEWPPSDDDLTTVRWREEDMVVILPPDYEYVSNGEIELDDLAELTLIGGGPGTGTGTLLRNVLGEKAKQLTTGVSMGSTQAVKSAVMCGMGYSIVLKGSVENEIKSGQLVGLTLKGHTFRKAFHISRLKDKAVAPELEALTNHLIAA